MHLSIQARVCAKSGDLPMPVEWERIPDGVADDFRALDGDEIVGRDTTPMGSPVADRAQSNRSLAHMGKTGRPIPATDRPVGSKPTSHRNNSDPVPALSQTGFFAVRRVVRRHASKEPRPCPSSKPA
jgi:hypothetical protein